MVLPLHHMQLLHSQNRVCGSPHAADLYGGIVYFVASSTLLCELQSLRGADTAVTTGIIYQCERKSLWPILQYVCFGVSDLSFRVTSSPAEIRTRYLPNKRHTTGHYESQLLPQTFRNSYFFRNEVHIKI
jgi:hypothetical protein